MHNYLMDAALKYYLFYKPCKVLTQFSAQEDKKTLADFFKNIPKAVYPVGRLDYDSEGLLLLTNDKQLNHRLLHPMFIHEREYWVQVEGEASHQHLQALQKGVLIKVEGENYRTKPAIAKILSAPQVPEREPPIRFRKNSPTSWLSLTIKEGKNRQVRKMTAAVNLPTLRLLRYRIGAVTLEGMQVGEIREVNQQITDLLFQKSST